METLRLIVVLLHLIGFATLFGAWAAQAFQGKLAITKTMNVGLVVATVTGVALAAPWGLSGELNYVKIGVKLVVLLIIAALMGIGGAQEKKTGTPPAGIFWSIGILTAANAAVAVLWI